MYINRNIEEKVVELSKQFPVLMITGARQVGKSTLLNYINNLKEEKVTYVSLDKIQNRILAVEDPELFLETYKSPVIIDEFQYAPDLLSYVKIKVDEARLDEMFNNGKSVETLYYLTGSQSFLTMEKASETLAGRVGIIDLYGLSNRELNGLKSRPFVPEIEALRKELSSTMGSLQPTVKSMIVPKVATKEITDLKAGEDVRVITLNQEGTVVSVDKNKKEAVVQIGIMKMTLPFKSLQKAKKDVKKTVTKSTRNIIKSKSGNVKSEVDLRGMTLEEAIMEVEKYLDDAYVAGLENVTIIHGIGTGVLKSGLQDILRKNRHVKSQRAGQYGEGGLGVTIVTLK